MCNMIDALNNQVDLENDPRWIKSREGISALPVMLNVTDGSWTIFVKAKAGTAMATIMIQG